MRLSLGVPALGAVSVLAVACAPGGAGPAQTRPAPQDAVAAPERPIPYPVEYPPAYRTALERGTRAESGAPGPDYWQQWTRYDLTARLDVENRRLEARGAIDYTNNSPDTLRTLILHLYQNLHAPGAPRLSPQEVTGGLELSRVVVAGQELTAGAEEGPRYRVSGTRLVVWPPKPVLPGASVSMSFDWGFTVPQAGADGRMGWSEDNLFFIAYWYPQMAVYDDVVGWQWDPFMGDAEFYAGFGDYEYTVEAPEGWVVVGTGGLRNASETLAPAVRDRLRSAEETDEIVHVLTAEDFGRATADRADDRVTWRFAADSVRDVAFSVTRESLWDATRTPVGDRDGDGTTDYARVDALYRERAPLWKEVARYAQHSIDFLSRFTGFPYPWPHMSAVEGADIIGGGMEFPMMTLIGDYNARGDSALYYVTAHELAHMWVPMILANDEHRYSWMDEGTTSFNENNARMEFFPGRDHHAPDRRAYIQVARSGQEGEIMRWSDFHYPGPAFGIASYSKPASLLVALRGVLGEETFMRAYHEFIRRWAFRHPYPWDLFNTFESVSGRELDWFWRSWYYEIWTLDQAVARVSPTDDGTLIVIEDRGRVPMPVHLTVSREGGRTTRHEIPVDVWLTGATRTQLTLPPGPDVVRVEIDANHALPDINRANNTWSAR